MEREMGKKFKDPAFRKWINDDVNARWTAATGSIENTANPEQFKQFVTSQWDRAEERGCYEDRSEWRMARMFEACHARSPDVPGVLLNDFNKCALIIMFKI